MKLLLSTIVFCFLFCVTASAQETKTKPLTTPGDKVHNTLHPKSKVQHGVKYKHKAVSGKKTVVRKKTHEEALDPKRKTEKKS